MGAAEIEAFLTHLATDRNVAASTQNQALNALVFLYRQVLHKDLDGPIEPTHAKRPNAIAGGPRYATPGTSFRRLTWAGYERQIPDP